MSDRLPGGSIYLYGLFLGDVQIGFHCFANYVPHTKGTTKIYHANRLVVHPDYNGLGLGIKLLTGTAQLFQNKFPHYRVMTKFSSTPVYRAAIKDPAWRHMETKRLMGAANPRGSMKRDGGFREGGIKTYHFEFIGNQRFTKEQANILK